MMILQHHDSLTLHADNLTFHADTLTLYMLIRNSLHLKTRIN